MHAMHDAQAWGIQIVQPHPSLPGAAASLVIGPRITTRRGSPFAVAVGGAHTGTPIPALHVRDDTQTLGQTRSLQMPTTPCCGARVPAMPADAGQPACARCFQSLTCMYTHDHAAIRIVLIHATQLLDLMVPFLAASPLPPALLVCRYDPTIALLTPPALGLPGCDKCLTLV